MVKEVELEAKDSLELKVGASSYRSTYLKDI